MFVACSPFSSSITAMPLIKPLVITLYLNSFRICPWYRAFRKKLEAAFKEPFATSDQEVGAEMGFSMCGGSRGRRTG